MAAAKNRNPHRWSSAVKQLPEEHVVHLNPSADTRLLLKVKKECVPA